MNKCKECGKRSYVFSSAKFKNIKVKYCPKCNIYFLAQNLQLINFGRVVKK